MMNLVGLMKPAPAVRATSVDRACNPLTTGLSQLISFGVAAIDRGGEGAIRLSRRPLSVCSVYLARAAQDVERVGTALLAEDVWDCRKYAGGGEGRVTYTVVG
jgi:hypothetical protein